MTFVVLTTIPSIITAILPVAFSGNFTVILPSEISSKSISTSVLFLHFTVNVVLTDLEAYTSSPR